MFKVIKNLHCCYAHRLLNYQGKCAHLHGHNGLVQVEFAVEKLNKVGMVIDFDEIKRRVQDFLDREIDHKTILHQADPLAALLKEKGEPVYALSENPTAENLAKLIFKFVQAQDLPIQCVKFWETPSSCAEYSEKERGDRR